MVQKVFKALLALLFVLGAIEASKTPLKNAPTQPKYGPLPVGMDTSETPLKKAPLPLRVKDLLTRSKPERLAVSNKDVKPLRKDARQMSEAIKASMTPPKNSTTPPDDGRVFVINGDSMTPPKYGKVIIANKTSKMPPQGGRVLRPIVKPEILAKDGNSTLRINPNGGRLVNGFPTDISYYPFVVSIKSYVDGGYVFGTGSLITSKCVLTAAHCVTDLPNIEVCGGSNLYQTGNCRWYSGYTYIPGIDLAIVFLQDHLWGDNIWPIEMDYNFVDPDYWIQYIGFGGYPERWLSVANFQIEPFDRCWNEHETCYRDRGNWQFIEGGDSGGPLIFNGRQIGVATASRYLNDQYFNSIGPRLSNPQINGFVSDIVWNHCF